MFQVRDITAWFRLSSFFTWALRIFISYWRWRAAPRCGGCRSGLRLLPIFQISLPNFSLYYRFRLLPVAAVADCSRSGFWLLPILDSGDCFPNSGFWLQILAAGWRAAAISGGSGWRAAAISGVHSDYSPFWILSTAPLILDSGYRFWLRIAPLFTPNSGIWLRIADSG